LTSVDDQHFFPLISLDSPDTDYAQKRVRLRTNAFIGKVDFNRLCCGSEPQRREKAGGCHRYSANAIADCHSCPPFLAKCAGMCGARRFHHHHATAINNGRATKNQGSAIHPSAIRCPPNKSQRRSAVATGITAMSQATLMAVSFAATRVGI